MTVKLYLETYNTQQKDWRFQGVRVYTEQDSICEFLLAIKEINLVDCIYRQDKPPSKPKPDSNYCFDWYVTSGRYDLDSDTIKALKADDVQGCLSRDNAPGIFSLNDIAFIIEQYQNFDYPRPHFYRFDGYSDLNTALREFLDLPQDVRFIIN